MQEYRLAPSSQTNQLTIFMEDSLIQVDLSPVTTRFDDFIRVIPRISKKYLLRLPTNS